MSSPAPERDRTEEERSPASHLFGATETLLKISGVVAAFGYVSLRAHLNALGISSMDSLGIERYLMESYVVVLAIAHVLVSFIPILAISAAVCWGLMVTWNKCSPRRNIGTRAVTLLFVALLVTTASVSLWLAKGAWFELSWAVGILKPDGNRPKTSDGLFKFLVLFCTAGFVAQKLLNRASLRQYGLEATLQAWSARLSLLLLGFTAFHIPLVFGTLARSTHFAMAQAHIDGQAAPSCGLVVLQSSSDVYLWRASACVGSILVIPRNNLKKLVTGPTADLKTQVTLAAKGAAAPSGAGFAEACQ